MSTSQAFGPAPGTKGPARAVGLMTADGAELPLLIAWLLTERLPKPAWLLPPSDLLVQEACSRASPGCGGTLAGEAGPVTVAGLGDQVPAPWSLPRGAAVASFPEDRHDSSFPLVGSCRQGSYSVPCGAVSRVCYYHYLAKRKTSPKR